MPLNAYLHQRSGSTAATGLRKEENPSRDPEYMTGVVLNQDEPVLAHHENSDWAFVRNKKGDKGYIQMKHLRLCGKRCRAFPVCEENHQSHCCRICGSMDADHRCGDCPFLVAMWCEKARMYHGTKKDIKHLISANGMKASGGGRLGPGIYATTTLEAARTVAKHFHGDKAGIIVTLEVNLGNCKEMWDAEEGDWDEGGIWDSCYARHPPWLGLDHVREFVILDEKRCKVIGIEDA